MTGFRDIVELYSNMPNNTKGLHGERLVLQIWRPSPSINRPLLLSPSPSLATVAGLVVVLVVLAMAHHGVSLPPLVVLGKIRVLPVGSAPTGVRSSWSF